MATARKLPSGAWRVNLYVGKDTSGKRQYKSFTAPTKKAAEFAAAQFNLTRKESAAHAALTVGQAIDRYIDARTAVLSPSTVMEYRKHRKTAMPSIMDIPLSKLTDEHIQLAINEESTHLSPGTVRNHYTLLASALSAYNLDYRPNVKLPPRVHKEMNIPDADQLNQLLHHVQGTALELPIILAVGLGLRRSEICALAPEDYNAVARTLSINKAMVLSPDRLWVIKPPKSYAGHRLLAVPDAVAAALDRIPLPVTINPHNISNEFDSLKKKLHLNCRFHDLRHYHASLLLAIGVPDKYAMEIMGHANPNMLKTVYQHIMQDKKDTLASAINTAVSSIMQHEMQHEPQKTP